MNIKCILLLSIVVHLCVQVVPYVVIKSDITSATVWSFDNSPYIISDTILLHSTLTIESGVSVLFDSATGILVENGGIIIAKGTPTSRIQFTTSKSTPPATPSQYWKNIFFYGMESSTVVTTMQSNGSVQYIAGSIFEYCDFSYGGYLSQGMVEMSNATVLLNHTTVSNSITFGVFGDREWIAVASNFQNNFYGGVKIDTSKSNTMKTTLLIDCSFTNNTGIGANVSTSSTSIISTSFIGNSKGLVVSSSGEVRVEQSTFQFQQFESLVISNNANYRINILNTLFQNNSGQVLVITGSNSQGATVSLVGNKILNNRVTTNKLIDMKLVGLGNYTISQNIISDNVAKAIIFDLERQGCSSSLILQSNTMENNTASTILEITSGDKYNCENIQVKNNFFGKNKRNGGIGSVVVRIGAVSLKLNRNIFYSNYMEKQMAVTTSVEYFIDAKENFWDTQNISSVISDFFSDSSLSIVKYDPYLSNATFNSSLSFDNSILVYDNDTIWNGNITISKAVIISPNVTLLIQPGTKITMEKGAAVIVSGVIKSFGNISHPISFSKSNSNSFWSTIAFTIFALQTQIDSQGNYISGSIFQYTNLAYAGENNALAAISFGPVLPYFINSNIMYSKTKGISTSAGMIMLNSSISNTVQDAISVSYSSIIRIEFCSISFCGKAYTIGQSRGTFSMIHSTIISNSVGCSISFYGDQLKMVNNTFMKNTNALNIAVLSSPKISFLSNNIFDENIGYALKSTTGYSNLNIAENTLVNNIGDEIVSIISSSTNCKTVNITTRVFNNTIFNNTAEYNLIIIQSRTPLLCSQRQRIVVINNSIISNYVGSNTIFASGISMQFNRNIFNNIAPFSEKREFYLDASIISTDVDITENYWNSTYLVEIQSKIEDVNDSIMKPFAFFDPVLLEADVTSPLLYFELNSSRSVITWSGIQYVHSNIIIQPFETLVIESNTQIIFTNYASVIIQGEVEFHSLIDAPIRISGASWGSIALLGDRKNITISNVIIENGGWNALGAIVSRNNILQFENVTFSNIDSYCLKTRQLATVQNSLIQNSKSGICITNIDSYDIDPMYTESVTLFTVSNNFFFNISDVSVLLEVHNSATGIALENNIVKQSNRSLVLDCNTYNVINEIRIVNNTIEDSIQAMAIEITNFAQQEGTNHLIMSQNTIQRTSNNYALKLELNSANIATTFQSNILQYNSFMNSIPFKIQMMQCGNISFDMSNNSFVQNEGNQGIVFFSAPLCNPLEISNLIQFNQFVSNFVRDTIIGASVVVYGDGIQIHNNNFIDENKYKLQNFNSFGSFIDARFNFWNTTDANVIKHSLLDSFVSSNFGRFYYSPFLASMDWNGPIIDKNCSEGYKGENCDLFDCSNYNDCSGNGICSAPQVCTCNPGWTGLSCETFTCDDVHNCTFPNSYCIGPNTCAPCEAGWKGADCGTYHCDDKNRCSGSSHGICSGPNTCQCINDWFTEDCSVTTCFGINSTDASVCTNSQGRCVQKDTCSCQANRYTSANCSVFVCGTKAADDASVCSGHGSCIGPQQCQCNVGFTGNLCQYPICYGNASNTNLACSSNGTCTAPDVCSCGSYQGTQCETWSCYGIDRRSSEVCSSGNGTCTSPDNCRCRTGYTGSKCQYMLCNGIAENAATVCNSRGTCIGVNQCQCFNSTLYTGQYCQYPICYGQASNSATVCSNRRGTCTAPDRCTCGTNTAGSKCEYNVCGSKWQTDPFVCSQHGNCTAPGVCSCQTGYTGSLCQTPICFGNASNIATVCNSKGTCNSPNNCTCQTGYVGDRCQFTECFGKNTSTSEVCSGRGICGSPNNCTCPANTHGNECQYNICNGKSETVDQVCNFRNGTCVGPNQCKCNANYIGFNCQIPICFNISSNSSTVCNGHGICNLPDTCTCDSNFTGEQCQFPLCFQVPSNNKTVCSGRGDCIAPNKCNCTSSDFIGINCEIPVCFGVAANNSSVCGAQGTCISNNTCLCNSNYVGSNCEIPVCFGLNATDEKACSSGRGTCISNDICNCKPNYSGLECQFTLCNGINSSDTSHVCSGGRGVCQDYNKCIDCNNSYFGSDCDQFTCFGILHNESSVCNGVGSCIAPDVCSCRSNFTGIDCSIPICNGVNATDLNSCLGRGSCQKVNGDSFCNCTSNLYVGNNCEFNICNSHDSSNLLICSSKGTCATNGTSNFCYCQQGYTGTDCEFSICNGVANSSTAVCSGNGVCLDPNTCLCNDKFTGNDCQIPICYNIPATNRSTCSSHGICSNFNDCICEAGYYGADCSLFSCYGSLFNETSVTCSGSKRGECVAPDVCICKPNYFGNNCEYTSCFGINSTDIQVCTDKRGDCVDFNNCACKPGYYGHDCSISDCFGTLSNETTVCSSVGNCLNINNCTCPFGYYDEKCATSYTCYRKSSFNESVCSFGQGICLGLDYCECKHGFVGKECERVVCENSPLVQYKNSSTADHLLNVLFPKNTILNQALRFVIRVAPTIETVQLQYEWIVVSAITNCSYNLNSTIITQASLVIEPYQLLAGESYKFILVVKDWRKNETYILESPIYTVFISETELDFSITYSNQSTLDITLNNAVEFYKYQVGAIRNGVAVKFGVYYYNSTIELFINPCIYNQVFIVIVEINSTSQYPLKTVIHDILFDCSSEITLKTNYTRSELILNGLALQKAIKNQLIEERVIVEFIYSITIELQKIQFVNYSTDQNEIDFVDITTMISVLNYGSNITSCATSIEAVDSSLSFLFSYMQETSTIPISKAASIASSLSTLCDIAFNLKYCGNFDFETSKQVAKKASRVVDYFMYVIALDNIEGIDTLEFYINSFLQVNVYKDFSSNNLNSIVVDKFENTKYLSSLSWNESSINNMPIVEIHGAVFQGNPYFYSNSTSTPISSVVRYQLYNLTNSITFNNDTVIAIVPLLHFFNESGLNLTDVKFHVSLPMGKVPICKKWNEVSEDWSTEGCTLIQMHSNYAVVIIRDLQDVAIFLDQEESSISCFPYLPSIIVSTVIVFGIIVLYVTGMLLTIIIDCCAYKPIIHAKPSTKPSYKSIIYETISSNHLWISILFRPKQTSSFTRSQRLTVVTTNVIGIIGLCYIFTQYIELYPIESLWKNIAVGICTSLIMFVISSITSTLFHFVKPIQPTLNKKQNNDTKEEGSSLAIELDDVLELNTNAKKSAKERKSMKNLQTGKIIGIFSYRLCLLVLHSMVHFGLTTLICVTLHYCFTFWTSYASIAVIILSILVYTSQITTVLLYQKVIRNENYTNQVLVIVVLVVLIISCVSLLVVFIGINIGIEFWKHVNSPYFSIPSLTIVVSGLVTTLVVLLVTSFVFVILSFIASLKGEKPKTFLERLQYLCSKASFAYQTGIVHPLFAILVYLFNLILMIAFCVVILWIGFHFCPLQFYNCLTAILCGILFELIVLRLSNMLGQIVMCSFRK